MNNFFKYLFVLGISFLPFLSIGANPASFSRKDFVAKFIRIAEQKIKALEKQNELNNQHGQEFKNQYLVYINCLSLLDDPGWVGSTSSYLKDDDVELAALNQKIVTDFDKVYNLNGSKKARFYILFVDNFPVFIEQNTDVKSYSDLAKKQPDQLKQVEDQATTLIEATLPEIYRRAPDLKTYENWVAYAVGTVVAVKNVKGSDKKVQVAKKGFSYLDGGGIGVKGNCYLTSSFSVSPISGKPIERLKIRVGNMLTLFPQILDNGTSYQNFNCGEGGGNGTSNNLTVNNYSGFTISNEQLISNLMQGKSKIVDPIGGQRHDLQVRLYLTSTKTEASLLTKAEKDVPPAGIIKVWVHHDGSTWQIKSGLTSNATSLNQEYTKNGYALNLNDLAAKYKDTEVDKMCTALYEFFDWVSKGIEKAKVPAYVWNCDSKDQYQPVYATVYSWATAPLMPLRLLVQNQFKVLFASDPQNAATLQKLQNPEQIELAAICGVWNGLIDIVAGVPKMISMLAALASSKGWDDMSKLYGTMSKYDNPDTKNKGVLGALGDGVSGMFNPEKPCELAHNASGIVIGIAICFINPAAIEGTFGKVISTVVKIVQRMEAFTDAINPLSRISAFAFKSLGVAMRSTIKNGKLIIKVALRADEVFGEIDWRLVKTAALIGPDGRTYTVLVSSDPIEAAKLAGKKIKEIVKDEQGKVITDAQGNALAKIEVTDANGKVSEEAVVVKAGGEVTEEAATLLTKLKARLKNVYKWTDEKILKFENDFKGNKELLAKFDGDEKLVEAWNALKDANVDEALRKDVGFLEVVKEYTSGSITRKFPNNLKLEEEAILRHYTTKEGYENFNKALRSEIPMTSKFAAQEKMMNEALDKLPSSSQRLTYRGTGADESTFFESMKVGDKYTYDNFISSSLETDIADDFMSRKGGSVVLVIEPKAGKSLGEISAAFESEILFKSKTRFEVVSKTYRPRFTSDDPLVREIHLKEVN